MLTKPDSATIRRRVRICLVYDCLYPHTVGGAERWYRGLAKELAAAGHAVTYVTRRQWPDDEDPSFDGVEVVGVSAGGPLYTADGRRRIDEAVAFGAGVLRHMLRNRHSYDAVHMCAFPYFSLPAVRLALAGRRIPVGVDWFEVWSRGYWREYLGAIRGALGHAVQRLCVRLTPQAYVFSELHSRRLLEEGVRLDPVALPGLYDGEPNGVADLGDRDPIVVFAGRHIREKRVRLIPAVIQRVRERIPQARAVVLGDGPERKALLEDVSRLGLEDAVEAPGFVDAAAVRGAFAGAACMLLPSVREGYGLVVVEAAACGTPTVVAPGPDNAAAELVEDGVNGRVPRAGDPASLAAAVVDVIERGAALRESTASWFGRNADNLALSKSARTLAQRYAEAA
jgi:glycosyltransferase involved in cell wall biosynthesis